MDSLNLYCYHYYYYYYYYLTLAPALLDTSSLQPPGHTFAQCHGADEVGGWDLEGGKGGKDG